MDALPAIDISGLRAPERERRLVAAKLGRACRGPGFFYATGHGVPATLRRAIFAAAADQKEAFNVGLDLPADDPELLAHAQFRDANSWPDLPGRRDAVLDYYAACHGVMERVHPASRAAPGVRTLLGGLLRRRQPARPGGGDPHLRPALTDGFDSAKGKLVLEGQA